MKKRMVVLLLALAMTVSSLAGCGSRETTASERMDDETYACEEPAEAEYDFNTATETTSTSKDDARGDKSKTSKTQEVGMEACDTEECDDYSYDDRIDGETYKDRVENGFTSVALNPLSTFAADVDTAGYTNVRRLIEDGYGISNFPGATVKTEEMVNYFKYDYGKVKKGDVFGVDATISDCPWNEESKLMVLGVTTNDMEKDEMPDSNIVFLIDVSGSMKDDIKLIKQSMKYLVKNLDERDRVSIVTYASGVKTVLKGASGDDHNEIMKAFNSLEAGGGTNGSDGIQRAYDLAERYFIEDGNNRVILCTDGDFNIGISSEEELYEFISEKKETGVFLSVLGFGMWNLNDVTMETLADSGNGNYAYIDNLTEAKKVLVEEMSSTLVTVAKDTKFQVEFNPALVSEYRLLGYENRMLDAKDFKDDTKDGGEIGAGHQVTAIYEIKLVDEDNENDGLKYQNSTLTKKGEAKDEWCTLSIAYKEPDKEKSKYLEYPIGVENYTKKPKADYRFAVAVAEFSLALQNSEFLADVDEIEAVEDVIDTLEKLEESDELDEYKEDFLYLVETAYEQ